jgi:hypothetical protein
MTSSALIRQAVIDDADDPTAPSARRSTAATLWARPAADARQDPRDQPDRRDRRLGRGVRAAHAAQRRATLVDLLDAGRALGGAATKDLNAEVSSAPGVSPAGLTELVDVLTEMRRDAGDF